MESVYFTDSSAHIKGPTIHVVDVPAKPVAMPRAEQAREGKARADRLGGLGGAGPPY